MAGPFNVVASARRLLLSPRSATLTESPRVGGGRRMGRRIVWLAVVAALLAGGGFAAYRFYFSPPPEQIIDEPEAPKDTGTLPSQAEFERLAKEDPVGMYAACLRRYEHEGIKGFTAILEKHERVKGDLHEPEKIQIAVANEVPEKPHEHPKIKVRMIWESGYPRVLFVRNLASLYVAGQNKNHMLSFPETGPTTMSVDPKDRMARNASRYSITDAGLYRGMLRTYDAWKKRQTAGHLHATFLGIENPPKADGRSCFVIRRTATSPEVDPFALDENPDAKADAQRDGAVEITAYIDTERWINLGTVLKRADGSLLGEYWFRNVNLSIKPFEPDPFTVDAVKAAARH
jgi:hypothetical protein